MRIEQEKVELFMQRLGESCPEKPSVAPQEEVDRRRDFIAEELEEYHKAALAGDLVETADAIADLLYVVLGAAALHGIDIQPIFDEVHRSNMTKDFFHEEVLKTIEDQRVQTKRCAKGPTFERPRIAELLLMQSCGLEGAELCK